jgi:putative SOS response-associated peptidase YedK
MCYSAQVVQWMRRLSRDLGIRLDYAEAERLYLQRLDGAGITISRGFDGNFDGSPEGDDTPAAARIREAIAKYRAQNEAKASAELATQVARRAAAERQLATRPTKRAEEELRISTRKMALLNDRLAAERRTTMTPRDNRIFPRYHAGVIVERDGVRWLTPMRYGCRPAAQPASVDRKYPGLYNARRDNLTRFWREEFGRCHAVLVVERFYESVAVHAMEHRPLAAGEPERSVELCFAPEPPELMFIACLWSRWRRPGEPELLSFAAVTDEPPAAVAAAGHDRCIINLAPEHVGAWLTPEGRPDAELQAILDAPRVPEYRHAVADAA